MKDKRLLQIGTAVLTIAGCLAVATVLYAAGGGGHGEAGGSLAPEKLWDLLWRVLNFAGLAAILVYFLRKPIANGLSARRQSIEEQFEDLDASKSEAETLYKEYESKLTRIDAEVTKIIDAAVAQGELEKQKIIDGELFHRLGTIVIHCEHQFFRQERIVDAGGF